MSYYPPLENGRKVNMIKQKFEQNLWPTEETIVQQQQHHQRPREIDQQKETPRRSLSASPVKSKKNLKLNVSRQLSNPGGKNIKRTPAFRGDKLSRTKNLQSPTKEKIVSIVNQNVKIFEESPEYGKIGNVKKKSDPEESHKNIESSLLSQACKSKKPGNPVKSEVVDGNRYCCIIDKRKDCTPVATKPTRILDNNTVRTTVISRQKNISGIYPRDDQLGKSIMSNGKYPLAGQDDVLQLEKLVKNGAEYAKVTKPKRPSVGKRMDVREELSRRICIDIGQAAKFSRQTDDCTENKVLAVELSDTLKAALQAPLPPGPPPKKPPRTFLHSPMVNNRVSSPPTEMEINEKTSKETSVEPKISSRTDRTRDSKKMLEKLEHVLIQHQKALGAKVIMPRKENNNHDDFITGLPIGGRSCNPLADSENKEKCSYRENRLSRTLEDSKKLGSTTKHWIPRDSIARKHSTLECLPSLNCATWTSIYDRAKDVSNDTCIITKSEDSISNNVPLSDKSEFFDQQATFKRFSTGLLSTFQDAKKRQISPIKSDERVYAKPFAFDKNSGTDITGYGILNDDQHNYFSRSLQEERFAKSNENLSLFTEEHTCSDRLSRNDDISLAKPALHYMCTSIEPLVYEDNNNELGDDCATSKLVQREISLPKKDLSANLDCPAGAAPDKFNKIKVEELLNEAFGKFVMAGSESQTDSNNSSDTDSLASSPSMSEQLSSFNEKLRLFKNRDNGEKPTKDQLHRSLTEKRKNYVRRVSSKYSERQEGGSFLGKGDKLFQVCLLVELNLSTREPYIKDKYPAYAKTPAWIENFCFPDASDWPPNDSNHNQFYSLVLMDERGNRRYGYCRRVRPEDGPILPLAYCLITKYRASGFFHKVLLELESRHGSPDRRRTSFIQQLYNSPMPKPGQCLRMTINDQSEQASSLLPDCTTTKNLILSKFIDTHDESKQSANDLNSALLANQRILDNPVDMDFTESIIVRSADPRLEERDMSQLFDAVTNKLIIILFASLLLERKVVLLCEKLSKLSSCVDALQSLLYPFVWPHTFIPVLPDIPGIGEILQAPLPFVIGILKTKSLANADVASIRDGIVVDLDTSKIVYAVGDESSILPPRLQKGIRSALQLLHSHTESGDGIRNFLVSEAFLRVFVETCSHCDSHIVTQQDGKLIFQKESFVKASASSKTVQYFLEWFVETTMFNSFIQERIVRMEGSSSSHESTDVKLFYQRAAEYRRRADKNTESKSGCAKKKTLGDRLKDLTNFHT